MNFYYWFSYLQRILSFGYSCCMSLLLVSWIVLKNYRNKFIPFIAILNRWFWIYALLFTTLWIYNLMYITYVFQQLSSGRGPLYINTNGHLLQFLIVPFVFLFSSKKGASVWFFPFMRCFPCLFPVISSSDS
jgi:hypothetical protein